jgi:hypothetical protein
MLNLIDLFLSHLSIGQLFFFYFWLLAFPALGVAWCIELAMMKLFRNSKNDWRSLK